MQAEQSNSLTAYLSEDLARPEWRRSQAAYERYRARPSGRYLFETFSECIAASWWTATAPDLTKVFYRFEGALVHGDLVEAGRLAERTLAAVNEETTRGAIRFVLAARAALLHGALDLADEIVATQREPSDAPGAALVDSFLLRLRCRVAAAASNANLFSRILEARPPSLGVAVREWLHHRWRYEGPTVEMLEEFLDLAAEYRLEDKPTLSACLALAARVNAWDRADELLERHPWLLTQYTNVLPLAAHLVATGRSQDGLQPFSDLYQYISAQTGEMCEELARTDLTIAIVGNSSCERGKGKGALIDAHDHVVRFNYFEVGIEHEVDYGAKFTIHGRGPGSSDELAKRSLVAARTVVCTYDFLYVPRNWCRLLDLWRQGARIACFPVGFHRQLQQELHAEPSLGLAFCALAASLRGGLDRNSCYGFSFVDQVDPEVDARYFRGPPPALTHRWVQELQVFQRFFD